jgi:hypothetical protein
MIKRYEIGVRRGRKSTPGGEDDERGASKSRQSSAAQVTRE